MAAPLSFRAAPTSLAISPGSPQKQKFLHLCEIRCKDYTCISNVLPETVDLFTSVLPLLTSWLSTDSLVMPSNALDGIDLKTSYKYHWSLPCSDQHWFFRKHFYSQGFPFFPLRLFCNWVFHAPYRIIPVQFLPTLQQTRSYCLLY